MTHLLAVSAPALAPPAPTVSWIPGAERLTPRPKYLDGSLAADGGFDPLGFCVNGLPNGMPGTFSATQPSDSDLKANLMWMREAEIKHSRLAMLAAAGWPLAELWHGGLASALGAPYALEATQGRSPSLLNGHLFDAAPFLVLATLGMIAVELKTLDQVYGLTSTGKTINANGDLVMKSYVPGDLGFDPLGLYDINSMQVPPMIELRMKADPQVRIDWVNFNRKQMEAQEIYHGRAAMIGITGFAVQEFITGQPIVDQTSLFFTPFWEILAPGLASSLAQDLGF